jgi:hypothetical protein
MPGVWQRATVHVLLMNAPPLTVRMDRAAASVGKRWPASHQLHGVRFVALTNPQQASGCRPHQLPDDATHAPAGWCSGDEMQTRGAQQIDVAA